jgi:AcrR family transcriptional regulator
VLRAGVALADREGIAALSMRRLAAELDYEVMSLYHHVANKDDLFDGMVELVAAEIDLPDPATPWREALRQSAVDMRAALVRHPWAVSMWFSRVTGPARMRIMEAQLGALARSGIDPDLAHVGFHALLNHVLGYALQEQSFVVEGDAQVLAAQYLAELSLAEFPNLIAHIQAHLDEAAPADDFGFVIDLILDRLAAGA